LQYKEKVYEFTCGSAVEPAVDAFRYGLSYVFRQNVWTLLSATEMLALIAGEESPITIGDLSNHVELSNGYAPDSPEIRTLFKIVGEMDRRCQGLFLAFVTGSSRLPIGGLANLRPRITIARKNQCSLEELPSATVCYHYFKLPPYPTKELMSAKLFLAIEEGQERFTMS
jgi:E3 ubiquitin-protein ligase TRIP12